MAKLYLYALSVLALIIVLIYAFAYLFNQHSTFDLLIAVVLLFVAAPVMFGLGREIVRIFNTVK